MAHHHTTVWQASVLRGAYRSATALAVDVLHGVNHLLAELAHARGSVALAEFRAVLAQDKGAVGILGPRKLQRIQYKALPQRIGQVLLRTYYVGDSHLGIIHFERMHVRKVRTRRFKSYSKILRTFVEEQLHTFVL